MPDQRRDPPPTEPWFDRLRLKNVRCFEETDVPLDQHVTVIIGENGAGKTTIAEALASMSFGEDEGLKRFPFRHDGKSGQIALYEVGTTTPTAQWSAVRKREPLEDSRYLFAYGRYRRVQYDAESRGASGPQLLGAEWDEGRSTGLEANLMERVRGRRTTTLFSPDNHILRDLGPTLVELNRMRGAKDADDVWDALERAIVGLKHGLTGVKVIERDGRDVAVVQRRGLDLPLRDLSDGYQAMLVIILDLVIRYVYLSPLDEPMKRVATVVIDEVDLHLHPRWQRRVVRQLTKLFPATQFILTTHSPAVVQGAIDFGHQVLVLRQNKDGVSSVVPLSDQARRDLDGAQLGSVLVDDHLFGVSSRYSSKYGLVEQNVRKLREKMEAGTATDADRDALIEGLDTLEGLVAAEEERQVDGPLLSEIAKVQLASLRRLAELNKEAEGHGQA